MILREMLWFYNYTTPRNSPTAKIVNIRNLEGWKDLLETCRADFSPVRLYCININKKKTSTHTDTYTHTRAQTHTHSYISHTNKQHTCETHTGTKVSQKEPRLVVWDADIRTIFRSFLYFALCNEKLQHLSKIAWHNLDYFFYFQLSVSLLPNYAISQEWFLDICPFSVLFSMPKQYTIS